MEPTREFSKTVLTLDNCIVPREKLLNTPSAQDGVSHELEVDLRLVGCEYIQTAGLLLKLPQVRRKVPAPISELGYDVILALVVVYILCIFLLCCVGCHGYSSGAVPEILLLQVIREVQSSGQSRRNKVRRHLSRTCSSPAFLCFCDYPSSTPLPPLPPPSPSLHPPLSFLSASGHGLCVCGSQDRRRLSEN